MIGHPTLGFGSDRDLGGYEMEPRGGAPHSALRLLESLSPSLSPHLLLSPFTGTLSLK